MRQWFIAQEIFDTIMMHLDTKDILHIGEQYLSKYVWLRKKDKNLGEACKNRNLIGVKYLVERKNYTNINTAFSEAIRYECFDVIKYCIEHKVDVNSYNGYALKYNACRNNLDIVRYLVNSGANIHRDINNVTLQNIINHGSLDVLRYFVDEKHLDIRAHYINILRLSAKNGHLHIIKYCVEKGVNLYTFGNGILQLSARNGNFSVVQYFLENNSIIHDNIIISAHLDTETISDYLANVTMIYKDIFAALVLGAAGGYLDIVKQCIKYFANIHINIKDGDPFKISLRNGGLHKIEYSIHVNISNVLHASIQHGHLSVTEYLVAYDRRANISAALHIGIMYGNLKTIKYFVNQGVNININEALRASIEHGYIHVLRYLVKYGVNLHDNINSMLQYSIRHGHLTVVKYLVELGADIKTDIDSTLKSNMKSGSLGIIRYLIESAGGGGSGDSNVAVLQLSIQYDRLDVVKYLIKCNADTDTILRLSIEHDKQNIIRYLIKKGADKGLALRLSIECGRLYIIQYLVKRHYIDICVGTLQFAIEHHRIDVIQYVIKRINRNINIVHNGVDVKFVTKYKQMINYITTHIDRVRVIDGAQGVIITADSISSYISI
jgi:ankyrin repeat protein